MAFVPETRVVKDFNLISQSVPEDAPPAVFDFVDYIADTYVGRGVYEKAEENENEGLVIRIRRTPGWQKPTFAPNLWLMLISTCTNFTNICKIPTEKFIKLLAQIYVEIFVHLNDDGLGLQLQLSCVDFS